MKRPPASSAQKMKLVKAMLAFAASIAAIIFG